MSKTSLIDITTLLPNAEVLDNLLSRFIEYTEKDRDSLDIRDDIMTLAIGYQTVRLFGFLSEIFTSEQFKDLTGKELSEVLRLSMDYYNHMLDLGERFKNDSL